MVHPTAPVLLTKSGPLGTRICCPAPIERVGLLTHLKQSGKRRHDVEATTHGHVKRRHIETASSTAEQGLVELSLDTSSVIPDTPPRGSRTRVYFGPTRRGELREADRLMTPSVKRVVTMNPSGMFFKHVQGLTN